MTSDDRDPAQTLVEQALAALERDGRVDLAALCKDRPDLLPIVEAAFANRTAALELGAPAAASERDPMIGKRLGNRYELLRQLGAGAMGAVYEARDTVLGRAVAAKVLHRSLFGGEEHARQRFQREARAAAALRHPGIVTVHDHDDGDPPYLIMDLVRAPDLKTIVVLVAEARDQSRAMGRAIHRRFFANSPQGPWDRPWPMLVASLLAMASRAVAAAHEQGVVHRDLKPSNLLVRADASAVVVDFGLARAVGDATLTKSETVVGSPSYMSPEQAAGRPPAPATDIYSLGATLYHALALRPPFIGDVAAVLMQVQREAPVPVQRAWPSVPRDLAVICQKAMAREPADRYGSAQELAEDFEAFLALRPIKARPLSWPQRAVRWARRRPAQATIAVLALVLAPTLPYATTALVAASDRNARAAAAKARPHVPALAALEGRNPAENFYRSDKQDVEARKALDAVLAADPRDEEALAMRAMLHSDEGRREEALADLRALSAVFPDAKVLAAATAALASSDPGPEWPLLPDLPEARTALDHFLLAYWRTRSSLYKDAATELEEALRLDENHAPSCHLQLLVLAVLDQIGDVQRAVTGVEERLGGPTARTRHACGFAWARKEQWQRAADALEESRRLASPSAGTLVNLATANRHLGDVEGALKLLEQAAAIRPEARGVFARRIKWLSELGREQEAKALSDAVPDNSPASQSTRAHARGKLLLDKAMNAHDQGEIVEPMRSEAEAALKEALEGARPDRASAIKLDLITAAFLRDGDHQKAFDAVLKVIGPEANAVGLQRAWYHAKGAGMPSVARDYLERANVLDPTHRDCARMLATALLDDEPPAPARALQVLAAALRTRADWAGNWELTQRAIDACLDAGVLPSALPALANAAETGLFDDERPSERLVAALRTISKNPRSLPPSLSALLSR